MIRKALGPGGLVLALGFGAWIAPAAPSSAQEAQGYVDLSARVWLDRGDDPVLQSGDRVRIYYRASYDAYVAVFQVTTDGVLRLMYPAAPHQDGFARGGRDYRVLLPESPYWFVDDAPGMGYFFVVASPDPMDYSGFAYSRQDGGWDLSLVGQNVYTDPYLAMDDVVAALIPDWEYVPYALDFLSYDVGGAHDYPRFLCYDCHGYRPYNAWDPYQFSCVSFRLVIWDDPYYYPAYRYSGTRVVWTRPAMPGRYPRFSFKERAAGEPGAPELVRREISAGSGAPVPSDFTSAYRSGSGGRSSLLGVPTAQPRGLSAGGTRPVVSPDPRGTYGSPPRGVTSSRGAVSGARQGSGAPPASGAPVVQRRPTQTSPPTRPSARVNTTRPRGSARPPAGGVSSPPRTGTGSGSARPGRVVNPRQTVSPPRSGTTGRTVTPRSPVGGSRSVTPQRTVNPSRPPASSGRGGVTRTQSRSSPPVPTKRAPPSRPPPKKKGGGGGAAGGFSGR